jgi:mannan endo-1,4-beta-mannosidase
MHLPARRLGPISLVLAFALTAAATGLHAASVGPVTPDALPETRALLQLLHDVSGRQTFTGQHNFPNIHGRNSEFATRYVGHEPVIWGCDMGFAKDGDTDSYLARPDIVQEAIAQHRRGAIVALCWHAVPPTADEPVTFHPLPGADPKHLASVQGQLTDGQFRDVLTPGTALYEKWCRQVDAVAGFLKQLEAARVPVLWRPYHEMNGDWFWWGGRTGEYSSERLYRQIFDRYVNVHHLKNLVWVWSVDRVHGDAMAHAKYFPGIQYVDVLALDVYGNDFAPSYYDSLVALARGKPLALAEVGNPPTPAILAQQPGWTYYMTWTGMVRNTSRHAYAALMADHRIVNLDDPAYAQITAGYRRACGLPPVKIVPLPVNFSGTWVLDEDASLLGQTGAGSAPAKLEVVQQGDEFTVRTTRILEYADDEITEEKLTLDGAAAKSEFMGGPRITSAHRSAEGRAIATRSTVSLPWDAPGATLAIADRWTLNARGQLVIERTSTSPRGNQKTTLVFNRR